MFIKVLGAAAGGGFPQWNCNYYLSQQARQHNPDVVARTQSSLAVSQDQERWVVFNTSPDIREQIANTPQLQPRKQGNLRNTPIAAVVLTNGDVDHIAGLLSLREREPFVIYATQRILDVLDQNPIFNVLDRNVVERRVLSLDETVMLHDVEGKPLGIEIQPFVVPGKIALFLEDANSDNFGSQDGDTIGVAIYDRARDKKCVYIPGCATLNQRVRDQVKGSDCLFFDGTLYKDDEMIEVGVGSKTGARMGHMSISGPDGAIAQWGNDAPDLRIFIHINNTNPVLDDKSQQRQDVENTGWQIAYDGMELDL